MKKADIVLFIDDEPGILSALRRELRDWGERNSIRLKGASSAAEGLDVLQETAADCAIVVSDLRMPGMKGTEFLPIVRERWPHITTILLTGFAETEELMKAVSAGVFSYILKPWEHNYLISELDKALESQRLRAAEADRLSVMQEELRWAGELQRALLGVAAPVVKGIDLLVSWDPLPDLACGGDYYEVTDLGNGRCLLLIGDVAGHGLRAALVTSMLKALVHHDYATWGGGGLTSPAAFLDWLGKRLDMELEQSSGLFVSFLAVIIDREAMSLRWANAGHCRPVLVREGAARPLGEGGTILGAGVKAGWREESIALHGGDIIMLHTDGLSEAGRARGGAGCDLASVVGPIEWGSDYNQRVKSRVLAASATSAFEDDVCILSARIDP